MSFLDVLLQTYIFQGVSKLDLMLSLEKFNIEFSKYSAGEQIVSVGDPITHIKILISGKMSITTTNKPGVLKVNEVFDAPEVISGNYVFGLETKSIFDVFALTNVGVMQIRKEDFLEILRKDSIFSLNYYSYLSLFSQKNNNSLLSISTGELTERFALWVLLLTNKKSTSSSFVVTVQAMAKLLGDTEDNLLDALYKLERLGFLSFTESEITILDRRGLADFVHSVD